jgi:hypothetical protein
VTAVLRASVARHHGSAVSFTRSVRSTRRASAERPVPAPAEQLGLGL